MINARPNSPDPPRDPRRHRPDPRSHLHYLMTVIWLLGASSLATAAPSAEAPSRQQSPQQVAAVGQAPPQVAAVGQADTLPMSLQSPSPRYPLVARTRGWEGTTVLRVQVLTDGTTRNVEVLQTSGHQVLDDTAVVTVRGWLFSPARKGEKPVDSWVEIPIRYALVRE